jgi:long-subunit acyl-CoA synthetase (AMP-forming)
MKFFKNYAKCLPLLQYHQTRLFNSKLFLRDQYSEFTFSKINYLSYRLSEQLLESLKVNDLNGEKIGVFCSNNYTYLISLLAIWRLKGVPMCLSKLYPINYLDYFITDSKCKLIINGINTNEFISESTVNLNALTQNKNTINFILNENEFFNLQQVDNSVIEMVDL